MTDYSYGIDKELKAKQDSKYDAKLESEVRRWIEGVTGDRLGSDLGDALHNGVTLCKLINAIKPGSVRTINSGNLAFKQMENIGNFLSGCESIGMKRHDLFQTVDLYEKKNMVQVVSALSSVGGYSQKVSGFRGPYIGVKMAEKQEMHFTQEQLSESKKTMPLLHAGIPKNQADLVKDRIVVSKDGNLASSDVPLMQSGIPKGDADLVRNRNVRNY